MQRPLGPEATTKYPSPVYRYGTTEVFTLQVHHGIDFDLNPKGLRLLAVGSGTVVTAGFDEAPLCGQPVGPASCGPAPRYYGNAVVIQLDEPYRGQPLFVLYAHMETVGVLVGQHVQAGAVLGTLGETGDSALGPHLHLEVRESVNDYGHTRNAMLWLKPLAGTGILAGAAVDANGDPVPGLVVDMYRAERPGVYFLGTETYQFDDKPAVNADDELQENFVYGDLPVGKYIIMLKQGSRFVSQTVSIEEGKITFFSIVF